MVDPIFICAIAIAGLGTWEMLTGRPLRGLPRWPLSQRAMRLYGTYCLVLSLVVIALAVTYPTGLAFMTYGIGILAAVATVHLLARRKAST